MVGAYVPGLVEGANRRFLKPADTAHGDPLRRRLDYLTKDDYRHILVTA